MATCSRKTAAIIAVLGVLGGGMIFFQAGPNFPRDTARSPRPADGPDAGDLTVLAAPHSSAVRPAIAVADLAQSPTRISLGSAIPPAAVEVSLLPPPSGDFDLTLTAEQINALVETRYSGLFHALGLPADRLARLRALLAERQQATVDAANAALMVGLNPIRDLTTIRRAIEEVQAPIDAALRDELGEPVFAACRDADSAIRERNSTGDLARLLAGTSEPLRPEQEKQVMQILKNSPGQEFPMDMDRAIYGGINDRARISDQTVAAAAKVLSPRQLERFRQLQQR